MTELQIQLGDLYLRPPYLTEYSASSDALFALPTLLLRADTTPNAERPRDAGFVTDVEGKPVEDPGADASKIGFESNPNLAWEKWVEFWRKMHGPRFTFKESASDQSMAKMLRYDQSHRLPGGPTSIVSPPYNTPTTPEGLLHVEPLDVLSDYVRPNWDGYADMAFETMDDAIATFSAPKFVEKLVPEQRLMFRSNAAIPSKEIILLPSPRHRDPISMVKIHYRKKGITREQWQERWLHRHAPLILKAPATHLYVRRYAQLHSLTTQQGDFFWHPEGSKVDGISVLSFAGVTDLEDYLITPDYREIGDDESEFTDVARSEYWTAINYHIINRLYPELRTRV